MRCMASPTLNTDGLRAELHPQEFPHRPHSERIREKSYRIEIQDYSGFSALPNKGSAILAGLLWKASFEHGQASVKCIRLYRQAIMTDGKSRPLSHGWRPCSSGNRFQTDGI
jgi:hypothetical protein